MSRWTERIRQREEIPMKQRAIAFILATGMALAGVTLPEVANADRGDHDRDRVNARNDTFCCVVPGSTLTISFAQLLGNDTGRNLHVVRVNLLPRFRRDVARFRVNYRTGLITIVFRNNIRDNFVNFRYTIAGRHGRDSAFVHIRRGHVSEM
jgi:hypothetical protein